MTRSSCEWGGAYKNASALEGEGGRVRSTLLTSESAVLGHHGVPGRKWCPSHNKDDRHCPRTPVSWGHDFSPKTDGVRGHRLLFPDTWCPRTPSGHGWRPRTVPGVSSVIGALGHPFASSGKMAVWNRLKDHKKQKSDGGRSPLGQIDAFEASCGVKTWSSSSFCRSQLDSKV